MKSTKSLLKNALGYSMVNILNAAIPFFMLPILTRVLLPEEYGVIAMFNATLGFLGAFTGLSAQGSVNVRYVDRDEIDYPCFIGSNLFILLISTFFTLIVILLFSQQLSEFTSVPSEWIIVAVLIAGLNILIQFRLSLWMMAGEVKQYGKFQIAMALANMSFSLFFVLVMKLGYDGRFLGQTVAAVLFGLIGFVSIVKAGFVSFSPKWEYVKEALHFGVPLIPHIIGIILMGYADRFLISKYLGLESTGIYMVAAQFGLGMGLLADSFNKAFIPWLFEQLKDGRTIVKEHVVKVTWLYFIAALVLAGVLASVAYWILYLIAGENYTEATAALQWIFFGLAFHGMYLMVTNYIFYTKKTYMLAWITLLSGGISFILAWLLIPLYGITGAGMAYFIVMVFRFLLVWYFAQKAYVMPWFEMIKR